MAGYRILSGSASSYRRQLAHLYFWFLGPCPATSSDPVAGQGRALFVFLQQARPPPLPTRSTWKALPWLFLPLGNPEGETGLQVSLQAAEPTLLQYPNCLSHGWITLLLPLLSYASQWQLRLFKADICLGLFWPFPWSSWIIPGSLSPLHLCISTIKPVRQSAGGRSFHLKRQPSSHCEEGFEI